jgi:hypothetical protein
MTGTPTRYLTAVPTGDARWDIVDVLASEKGDPRIVATIVTEESVFEVTFVSHPDLKSFFPSFPRALAFLENTFADKNRISTTSRGAA